MDAVQVGDHAQVGNGKFAPVCSLAHLDKDVDAVFLQIHLENTKAPLEITSDHLVFAHPKSSSGNAIEKALPASKVDVGDWLVADTGEAVQVVKIDNVKRHGVFAPFTTTGEIVVSGVVASTHAMMHDENLVKFLFPNIR